MDSQIANLVYVNEFPPSFLPLFCLSSLLPTFHTFFLLRKCSHENGSGVCKSPLKFLRCPTVHNGKCWWDQKDNYLFATNWIAKFKRYRFKRTDKFLSLWLEIVTITQCPVKSCIVFSSIIFMDILMAHLVLMKTRKLERFQLSIRRTLLAFGITQIWTGHAQ